MADGVLERLRDLAARWPDAAAVVEGGRVTARYGALFERAARLGSQLIERGVRPEEVVGLATPRGADHLVGLLGCWFAGAAFLPLEPTLPAARRALYLARAGVRWVLAPRHATPPLPPNIRALDPAEVSARARQPAPFDPERLAYVLFTSGSTGAPKGVLVTHRGLATLFDAQISAFDLAPGDRSLWLLSTAFDASISDVGTALLSGATLYVEADDVARSPTRLLEALSARAITSVDLPPALLPYLDERRALASLKTIIVGGEPCDPATVRRWARRVRLVNVYGPTEATICTSLCVCDPGTWDRPLLGTELPGVRYQVCDPEGVPCESGSPGELLISGACLARGYLGDPELTAARFVTHRGERSFRSGDRVVRRSDGGLEFLGRIDRQLKLRGVLVAPEEVEQHLASHPAVRRAAVVAGGAPATLSAWLEGEPVPAAEFRSFLAARLPSALIPSRFEWRASLPTTASGKIDFACLAQNAERARPSTEMVPESTAEREVAELFRQVLGVEVGLDDDFFSRGGDSLGLVELVARAETFGLRLAPELVYAHPSVRGLARALESGVAHEPMAVHALWTRVEEELSSLGPPVEALDVPSAGDDAVFVTGATGFLGARLVHELLARTGSAVFCLVRAETEASGRRRLHDALRAQGAPLAEGQLARVLPVVGELARVRFGLSPSDFGALARRVHDVFHCAAEVSLTAGRDALWAVNVGGTREVLRLIAEGPSKRLHYASTLAVFVSADEGEGTFLESDALEHTRTVYGGYAQTKWASERLVRAFRPLRAGVYVHRLGLLTGDSETGYCAPADWLARTVRGLVELGQLPLNRRRDLAFDVTPVDYAARAMVEIALRAPREPRVETVHLAGPRSARFDELVSALRASGVELLDVEPGVWQARLSALLSAGSRPEVASACLALQRACTGAPRRRELDLFQATRCRFDDRQARAWLRPAGVECPPVTPALLERYVRGILTASRRPTT